MAADPDDPIDRFWSWLEKLSLIDVLVVGIVAPILGLASVIVPFLLTAHGSAASDDLMLDSIRDIRFGRTILCLFGAGAVLALMSRKLGVWAASSVMAGYFLMVISDFFTKKASHNLLPFELAIYVVLTGFAMAGAGLVAIVRG